MYNLHFDLQEDHPKTPFTMTCIIPTLYLIPLLKARTSLTGLLIQLTPQRVLVNSRKSPVLIVTDSSPSPPKGVLFFKRTTSSEYFHPPPGNHL